MEASLRNRLTFGPIMLAALLGLLYVDYYVQERTRADQRVRETDERVRWSHWRAGSLMAALRPMSITS